MRQLSFQTKIGNYINSQFNLNFINHNFNSELLLSYYMFLLRECTIICKAFVIKRKVIRNEYSTSISDKSCKVIMQEKKRVHNSSETISSTSLNNNYFKIYTSFLLNYSFKISKIYLIQKIFS